MKLEKLRELSKDPEVLSEKETAGQVYNRLGMDGRLWAKEFVKTFPKFDEETAIAWFCSAIMAGYDKAIFRMTGKVNNLEAENAKLKTIVEAVKKLRVITPEEIDNNKPFWVIPCDSYKPLRIAMDELETTNEV